MALYRYRNPPKQFDNPYVTIVHKDYVQYLVLPARIHYHVLDPLGPFVHGYWHCQRCKLMGTLTTFKEYHCS